MSHALYPFTFRPIFKDRVWGGRKLEQLYGKALPPETTIGESWEITDRPEGVSVITNGPLAGRDLRWLMEHHAKELLGDSQSCAGRFPLLVKILDAREKLSLQVHPPAHKAAELRGEPKTEMWYVADATPEADLFVGLRRGATREEFERRIQDGSVAECFHRIPVKRGDSMFLPSGRVHALGAGNLIFEIQQNSDTTYRVFDWNRVGLDGKPRELHVPQALASIDFGDFEPALVPEEWSKAGVAESRQLADCALFRVDLLRLPSADAVQTGGVKVMVVAVTEGRLEVTFSATTLSLGPGDFCVVPASCIGTTLVAHGETVFLRAVAN
ncbi:MAG: mannose-6-phosphate isomerase [Proteobacteria bacterium]|jgi:mannose-6-phosphate isomerase|nr:mannose-6-phosphate isomerase [Pseudomonadota bacterium]